MLSIRHSTITFLAAASILTLAVSGIDRATAQLPAKDSRADELIDADHFKLRIKIPESREELEARRKEIRYKFLLTAGLWPLPEKCPLNVHIFDEKRGSGFRVAKVYFESLPGFYVTGNLYRPAEGSGPFPAVVCPHGHWYYGRLTNGESGSIPGRCIDLARMGFVVMSIDMVGYNDSFQFPHDPGKSLRQLKADEPVPYEPNLYRGDFDFPRAGLYGVSLAGLHVWNVIRTVDFLVSLPEVDPERIGCTGASGGASQTLFLMATDERLKVAAPVNIVGAEKHPGCRCENAPGSWVDISTVEIAGTFAPRPLILISATEDPWTNSFPTRELSIIKKYYALYGAEDKVTNAHIPGGHNYNAQSRAAVYNWFAEHLKSPRPAIKNPPAIAPEMKTLGDLRVFPDKLLPETSKSGLDVLRDWMASSEKAYEVALPKKGTELAAFTEKFGGALFRLLQLDRPAPSDIIAMKLEDQALGGFSHEKLVIGRQGKGDRVDVEVIVAGSEPKGTLVLVRPESRGGMFMPGGGGFKPALKNLAVSNYRICRVGGYASGELRIPRKTWDSFSWPEAYNRSNQLNAIQDVLTTLCYVKKVWPGEPIILAGLGNGGLNAAFAGAIFGDCERVIIDLDGHDPGYDGELLELLPVSGIKRAGDFRTAALMLLRNKLTLLNGSPTFSADWYVKQAEALGLKDNLELRLDEKVQWLNESL